MSFLFEAKEFMLKCWRVWRITKKPTTQEFKLTATAAAIGIILIGVIGFFISMIISNLKIF